MNDRPQRNDRSDRDPRDRNNRRNDRRDTGGQSRGYDRNSRGDRNDRPQRDERGGREQRGGYDRSVRTKRDFDRNDRPQRSGYGRDERPQRPSYGRDEQRPSRGGYSRDDRGGQGQRGGYDRGDRPQRPRYERDEQRSQRGGYSRDDQRPQRDDRSGREQRGGYDRNDRPQRSFGRNDRAQGDERRVRDHRSSDDRPQRSFDRGDRPQRDDRPRRDFDRRDRNDRNDRNDRPQRDDRPRREFDRGDRPRRDADRPRRRDFDRGDRNERGPREQRGGTPNYGRGGTRGDNRSDRGGKDREYTEAERLQHELRPVRASHQDPVIPEEVEPRDLHPAARNELKTLQADIQERVARHLAMVAFLIDEDPELAHQHALSASRRAGRIPVTRETLAITAYRTGDFALALRELRTYRRLSGLDNHVALMVDCERGLGRPERAIETGLAADASTLDTEQRVHLAIAMSGARLDLGQTQQALFELEIPELNPATAFSWSSHLFGAYAAVLEDLGRTKEAAEWAARSEQAANAVQNLVGAHDELEVFEIYETEHDSAGDSDEPGDVISEESEEGEQAQESVEISIEDEVDELLAEAGITGGAHEDEAEQDDTEQGAK